MSVIMNIVSTLLHLKGVTLMKRIICLLLFAAMLVCSCPVLFSCSDLPQSSSVDDNDGKKGKSTDKATKDSENGSFWFSGDSDGDGNESGDGDVNQNTTKEKLVVATNAAYPPYDYKIKDEFAGIDIDIAKKIAEKLGMELEIFDAEFHAVFTDVKSGKCDIGIAAIIPTEARLELVDFSKNYITNSLVVITSENSTVKDLSALAQSTFNIGVVSNTVAHTLASDRTENGGFGERTQAQDDFTTAVQALRQGKIGAIIVDVPDEKYASELLSKHSGLKMLHTPWMAEEYAIAVSKDNPTLLEKVNRAIDELTADGTIQEIARSHYDEMY